MKRIIKYVRCLIIAAAKYRETVKYSRLISTSARLLRSVARSAIPSTVISKVLAYKLNKPVQISLPFVLIMAKMNLAEVINISTGLKGCGVWLRQVLQVLRHEQSKVRLALEGIRVSLQQPTSTPARCPFKN